MPRAAVANEHASTRRRDVIGSRLQDAISPRLTHPAAMRAGFASAMRVGVVIIGRRAVRVPALADRQQAAVVRLLGPAVQIGSTGAHAWRPFALDEPVGPW